jgi:hypothetical protein
MGVALAGQGNQPKGDGTVPGQPFQQLQQQIDELQAQVDAMQGGVPGYEVVQHQFRITIAAGSTFANPWGYPEGKRPLGGGGNYLDLDQVAQGLNHPFVVLYTIPLDPYQGNGWEVSWLNQDTVARTATFNVFSSVQKFRKSNKLVLSGM